MTEFGKYEHERAINNSIAVSQYCLFVVYFLCGHFFCSRISNSQLELIGVK